jgi:hypothetical protein
MRASLGGSTAQLSAERNPEPSFIRTIPSAPELHRVMRWMALAGFTADREFERPLDAHHPAPKVVNFVVLIIMFSRRRVNAVPGIIPRLCRPEERSDEGPLWRAFSSTRRRAVNDASQKFLAALGMTPRLCRTSVTSSHAP